MLHKNNIQNVLPIQLLDPSFAVDFPDGHFVHLELDSERLVYPTGHLMQSLADESYLYPLGQFTYENIEK
jgi:hypothetical protein